MGRTLSLPVTIPVSAARAQLADFLRRRGQLVEMRKAERLRPHSAGQDEITNQIDAMITLLGELPELGTLCRRIAALAASRPMPGKAVHDEGRAALYIGALSASRRVPSLTAMRGRMRRKGKVPKTIIIAVARQLLVIINAMIRKRQPIAIH